MMRAAALTTRPVWARPSDDRVGRRRRAVPGLAHAGDEEDLVVHREPEEHREQEDGTQPSICETR